LPGGAGRRRSALEDDVAKSGRAGSTGETPTQPADGTPAEAPTADEVTPKAAKAPKAAKGGKEANAAKAAKGGKGRKASNGGKAEKAPKAPKSKAQKAAKAEKAPKGDEATAGKPKGKGSGNADKPPKADKARKGAKDAKGKGKGSKAADASARARAIAGHAGQFAAAAGAILGEVAGLVRQAAEPAAGRIVEMVGRSDSSVEPAPNRQTAASPAGPPADAPAGPPADAPAAAPEPTSAEAREPTTAAEPTTEPAPGPVPEPESGAASAGPDGGPRLDVQPGARIAAAIDVGATSVHLLVAAVGDHHVVPVLDQSAFLGLGDRVAADGRLGPATRDALAAAVAAYVDDARRLGADPITVVGTEPMRRADDASAAVHAVTALAGVPFHVVDHDEEGLLTLLGVTGGRPLGAPTLVVDIGGGSSEIVVTEPGGTVLAGGLPIGAAQLTHEHVRSDPPSLAELDTLRARIRDEVAKLPDLDPGEIVAVGGTASNLLKLLPATAIDRMLTRRRITVALAMLTVERSGEAAARHLIRPERARILPAGALIVDAILERFGADRLRVSEEGIRSGLLLATTAAGGSWRDRLPRLAGGWGSSPLD
jgi:hypothetical protein